MKIERSKSIHGNTQELQPGGRHAVQLNATDHRAGEHYDLCLTSKATANTVRVGRAAQRRTAINGEWYSDDREGNRSACFLGERDQGT